ncbi:MAG TPA: UDP-N-acetylmuramoyl-L-alanyl-D-glutamate--2,6-diaminopimelate ligase [Acidobacteriota bacterium]
MKLGALLTALEEFELIGAIDVDINGIAYDSKNVKPGYLFAALPGQNAHGLQFVSEVKEQGAAAILSDSPFDTSLPLVLVPGARYALANLSNRFYGEPSKKLKLVGITGTNGKTTVSFLVRSIFEAAGILCGLIGTIRYSGEQFSKRSAMTTPESVDLQKLLIQFLEEGSGACSMEVSSQGLDQHRVTGCTFEVGIFTNLTQDHLDYHQTMERYFQAKRMLFDPKYCDTKLSVINGDDPYGRSIIEFRNSKKLSSVSYGFENDVDYRITFWQSTMNGTQIVIRNRGHDETIQTPLIGKYNVYNVAAAYASMASLNIDINAIVEGIQKMTYIPGRLERLDLGQPFNIILDYAHTEDAFRQLLPTLRECTAGRIIHIFGCRGERDALKRPLMGQASAELADVLIVTSDNPVHEDPEQIANDIKSGIDLNQNPNVHTIVDRGEAIAFAVSLAKPEDTIVITGKGNETYQLIGDEKLHHDDREFFQAALALD